MKKQELNYLMKIRAGASRWLPSFIVQFLLLFYKKYKKMRMPEEHKSFGDLYPDRTFYVIRLYPPGTGFLANYIYILGYMHYAYEKGWIPVIDMIHYQNMYNGFDEKTGKGNNVWEWFFEQPFDDVHNCRYSLDEVYKSKNVILSCGSEDFHDTSFNTDIVKWQREMCDKIPFKKEMQKYVSSKFNDLKGKSNGKLSMGIPLRGTDLQHHVAGHYKQLSVSEAINCYEKLKKKWYKEESIAVFCNSEEQQSLDILKENIPNILYIDTKRVVDYNGKENAAYANKKTTIYEQLRDYVTNMYILSKCESVFGTMNNGLYTAFLWNYGEFTHFEVINLGKYR